MAVAAARAALSQGAEPVRRVVFLTRDLPLLEGGNGAALLAGIGLAADVPVAEQLGGAPAVAAALAQAAPGTLVVAADLEPAGAAAALVGDSGSGSEVELLGQITRSLPVVTRGRDGVVRDYEDPRLLRERGVGLAVDGLALATKPDVIAGVAGKAAAALCAARPPELPTTGASATVFAIAAVLDAAATERDDAATKLIIATEQASAVALRVGAGCPVHRDEPAPQPLPVARDNPGPQISISLAAYERAFESKLRWQAGKCDKCATLAFPPRYRCLSCGSEAGWSLVELPRTGSVYTTVTVHVAVPGLPTPYSLAIVELDDVGVRALVKVTGAPPGTVAIDDRGQLVLRRVAVRSGVPDYGYALLPDAAVRSQRTEGQSR